MKRILFKAPTLGSFSDSRDNNFTLIRLVAAVAVIFSHSFVLALGNGEDWKSRELAKALTGASFGELAVNIFFVTSGFLVYRSLATRGEILGFIKARCLRIYPALAVAAAFSALCFGPLFTTMALKEYFCQKMVYGFLVRNSLAIDVTGMRFHLPGVFESLPYPGIVNGCLWTLPWEIWMYFSLTLLGLLRLVKVPALLTALSLMLGAGFLLNEAFQFVENVWLSIAIRFAGLFYIGVLSYLQRQRIRLSYAFFGFLIGMLIVSWFTVGFTPLLHLTIAYGVFVCAYLPSGWLTIFRSMGDYSYGLYIYAYPIQQGIVSLHEGIEPLPLFAISLLCAIPLAAASWHWLEKPALRLKN